MVKEVLTNVDSDGSTLLHLAVDSESCAVSIFFTKQFSFNCDSSLRLRLIVWPFYFASFQVVKLCLKNGSIIRQPKVIGKEWLNKS